MQLLQFSHFRGKTWISNTSYNVSSMFLQRKLTVVCGKTHWDSDESTSSVDIVIAYFSSTYLVTKVGKYIIMHTNSTIMSNIM